MNGLWVIIPLLFLWESVGVILDQFNQSQLINISKKNDTTATSNNRHSYKPSIIYYYIGAGCILLYIILVPSILSMAPFVPVQM